jgi:hypothetical protein
LTINHLVFSGFVGMREKRICIAEIVLPKHLNPTAAEFLDADADDGSDDANEEPTSRKKKLAFVCRSPALPPLPKTIRAPSFSRIIIARAGL